MDGLHSNPKNEFDQYQFPIAKHDSAMVGSMAGNKRARDKSSGEERGMNSGGPSKRVRGGARVVLVFECTICGKACSKSSNLTIHMRTHSGDCPYPCMTCGMAFSTSGQLSRHMRTHSGDLPYP